MQGNLFIISSPSGGGKGTLIKGALERVSNLAYSISHTTREKRAGEEDGKNYYFVSVEKFKQLIEQDGFLEYAEVHGNLYGTSRHEIDGKTENGRDIILEIDVQGAAIVREKLPTAVSVFILPPSYSVLEQRLKGRKTESAAMLDIRLENAKKEVTSWKHSDYVVINDDLGRATRQVAAIIETEGLRVDRQTARIRDILTSFGQEYLPEKFK